MAETSGGEGDGQTTAEDKMCATRCSQAGSARTTCCLCPLWCVCHAALFVKFRMVLLLPLPLLMLMLW